MSTGAEAGELLLAGAGTDVLDASGVAARSPRQLFWRRFRRDRLAMVALGYIVVLLFAAVFAGPITRLLGAPAPNVQSIAALDEFGLPTGPSAHHIMGVDGLGRDVFSRVLQGAQVSLIVAIVGTGISVLIGVAMGLLAGYHRGWVDSTIGRTIDVLLAFPVLLLGLGMATACSDKDGCAGGLLQPGLPVVIFIIVLASWPYVARIIRGQVLSVREKDFVEASRSLGASHTRVIVREILPNLVGPILVYATLAIPVNILIEAALSYLGVGVQPPQASWGLMLADATDIFTDAWWYMLFPGLALLLTVLAFNLVGDGLQDALAPTDSRSH